MLPRLERRRWPAELRAGLPADRRGRQPDRPRRRRRAGRPVVRPHRAALLRSGEVDAVLLTGYFGGYASTASRSRGTSSRRPTALGEAAARAGRPVVVQSMHPARRRPGALRRGGVPVLSTRSSARSRCACGSRRAGSGPRAACPRSRPPHRPRGAGDGYDARARCWRTPACRSPRRGPCRRRRGGRGGGGDRLPGRPQGPRHPAQVRRGRRRARPAPTRARSRRRWTTWSGGSTRPRTPSSGWRRSATASSC